MKVNLGIREAVTAGLMLGGITVLSPDIALSQSANPNNITGRWSVVGNNTSIVLRITQASNGTISGTMTDVGQSGSSAIEGFYIPSVRRIVFTRSSGSNTFQFYQAWVSQNGLQIGGQFNVWRPVNGASTNGVDFNFRAAKTSDFPSR